jgi:membrane-bound lytic murein transglycosylase D
MMKLSSIAGVAFCLFLVSGCAMMSPSAPPATAGSTQKPTAATPSSPPTPIIKSTPTRKPDSEAGNHQKGTNTPPSNVSDASKAATDDDVVVDDSDETSSDASTAKADATDAEDVADAADPADADAIEKKNQPLLDEALEYCQLSQTYWQKGELEKALDQLDHAYALILKVDTEDNAKLLQQKEDLRFTISKRILEIYASRHIVVNGYHQAIPMVMNKYVQDEIKVFSTKERQFFINSYRRSGRFRGMIVKALRANGMPEELSWLPLIESGFKMRALSRARALGLWQFISSTGYKYGLKRTLYIDERLDPSKATAAAISYLKELHSIFGDWTTVLAAYNCGEGRVLQVIRSQNINYLDNFWDLYEKLPLETARYVPRFLAALHIIHNPEKYGFHHLTLDPAPVTETVTIDRRVRLSSLAPLMGIKVKVLKDLNPELRYSMLPGDAYNLRIPKGTQARLLAKIDSVPLAPAPQGEYILHRVRRGETLSGIASRYHTHVRWIKLANGFRGNRIIAGKKLKIPQRGAPIAPPRLASARVRSAPPPRRTHRVKRGDSLWNIARRYGTTTERIRSLNHLHTTRLQIGQVLKIRETPKTTSLSGKTYTVRKGDSPYEIAQKNNISLAKLLQINGLTVQSMIYPGQQLNVE